ncbi:MAG: hypothetical protein JGK01_15185 [Microcoleus sp. PH2017_03_ELD_O_A]|uniref:hypothetical protein n=1 Tax=unclassified Microcoleus TaxID=2642155 RepID=UPI001DD5CA07|nr:MULTISPECIES: hypothetical protein [unclassified Microcoleus]MCC3432153.1 hypothetical protein [Microcoleus sp. PH2017_04_SCI_O_A]MCC3443095.1 hypothetical protein [Microcoleus sp. PH2017_03_ELD_O_A]MCC3508720.1 hypothetical protein [Microcoleus sp. PH2017_17_BER_D_A]
METKIYQKELVESPKPAREKLKSDYSLLQSSDLRVEVALKLSTVNCQLSTVERIT